MAGVICDTQTTRIGITREYRFRHSCLAVTYRRDTVPDMNVGDITKKPARRLAFSCPKAREELLLRGGGSSGSRSSSGSSGRSSGSSGSRSSGGCSSRSSSGCGSRSGSSSSSGFGGLRSFSSSSGVGGLRSFSSGSRGRGSSGSGSSGRGSGGFGFATSRHSQGEEGSDEERLFHFGEILNVMEILDQLVDRYVAVSVNEK